MTNLTRSPPPRQFVDAPTSDAGGALQNHPQAADADAANTSSTTTGAASESKARPIPRGIGRSSPCSGKDDPLTFHLNTGAEVDDRAAPPCASDTENDATSFVLQQPLRDVRSGGSSRGSKPSSSSSGHAVQCPSTGLFELLPVPNPSDASGEAPSFSSQLLLPSISVAPSSNGKESPCATASDSAAELRRAFDGSNR